MAKSRYSSYISSKTLWQNEIPSHWQETELRMLFADNKNKNLGLVERNLLSLSYGKLKRKDIDNATGLVPASFEGYQIIDKGYIVLRFTDLQNDKKSLRVGYVEEKGIITSAYIGLAPKADIHSKYFYYQLHFLDKIKYFYNLGGGVRQSLAFKEFGRETVLIPPKEEQTSIARFLDYKLAKINRFIQKKKQLIKLLNEQKAAIINQAVTKGLDPNAKMKDSSIEWLGEIPEHWEVRKLKSKCKIFGRIGFRGYKATDLVEKGKGAITISPSNMKDYYMQFDNCSFLSWEKYDESPEIKINDGDILFVKTGSSFGKVTLVENLPEKATINPQIVVLKEITCDRKFLLFALNSLSVKTQIQLNVVGGTIPTISQSVIGNYSISFPIEIKEQQKIVSHIEQETATINTTISTIEKEIALVEEYKTALIAEAVTGKIDVRGYEVPEITEEETYDDPDSYREEEEISIAAEDAEEYQTIEE